MGFSNTFIPVQFFGSVPDALAPLSANTEINICNYCSGTTTSVGVPHATYSNGHGQAIVQLNTIVLGGINGLNL